MVTEMQQMTQVIGSLKQKQISLELSSSVKKPLQPQVTQSLLATLGDSTNSQLPHNARNLTQTQHN